MKHELVAFDESNSATMVSDMLAIRFITGAMAASSTPAATTICGMVTPSRLASGPDHCSCAARSGSSNSMRVFSAIMVTWPESDWNRSSVTAACRLVMRSRLLSITWPMIVSVMPVMFSRCSWSVRAVRVESIFAW